MLSGLRVLDLSTERGFLCGQILGDLGADVIKIEPPGGSSSRRMPPFLQDQPGEDRSLYWLAYNRNKRGITLDLDNDHGRDLLRQLAATADFLIESENPGTMGSRGLDYPSLAKINPAIVYISITPFGQTGPKASYADSDLIIMAAGGVLILYGDEDRPPIRMNVPQAYLHASADAAGAALIAYYQRMRSGVGQQVDVAAQESVTLAAQSTTLTSLVHGEETRRMSGGAKLGALRVPLVWPCKDGLVSCVFLFGSALGVFTRKMVDYMYARGECSQELKDTDWVGYGAKLLSGAEPMEGYERKRAEVAAFLAAHTKAELFAIAREHTLLIAPLSTIDDLLGNLQFQERQYWQRIEHCDGSVLTYPGPFARFSEKSITIHRRPPKVGEHNREIFPKELALTESEMGRLRREKII
jgi:crotonobetainyl-CoA:carnitine CoA-transferase CaiB-like acyl-CoA transferase